MPAMGGRNDAGGESSFSLFIRLHTNDASCSNQQQLFIDYVLFLLFCHFRLLWLIINNRATAVCCRHWVNIFFDLISFISLWEYFSFLQKFKRSLHFFFALSSISLCHQVDLQDFSSFSSFHTIQFFFIRKCFRFCNGLSYMLCVCGFLWINYDNDNSWK